MGEIFQKKSSDGWELFLILPRLLFIIIETLVDNELTIRSRVVSWYRSIRTTLTRLRAQRRERIDLEPLRSKYEGQCE